MSPRTDQRPEAVGEQALIVQKGDRPKRLQGRAPCRAKVRAIAVHLDLSGPLVLGLGDRIGQGEIDARICDWVRPGETSGRF